MILRHGVRLRRVSMGPSTSAGSLLAFALGLASCAGKDLVVAGERPRADPIRAEPDGPDGIDEAIPARDVTLVQDCPPSPEQRQAAPGCWPTRHIGVWRGFFIGVPRHETSQRMLAEFPRGDVLLQLGIDGAGSLIFGAPPAGVPSTEPPRADCAANDGGSVCARGLVIPGFSYRLMQLSLFDPDLEPEPRVEGEPPRERAERMEFAVRVGEPWDAWCAERDAAMNERCTGGDCTPGDGVPAPAAAFDLAAATSVDGCGCDATGCRAAAPSLSIALQMSDDREDLRGTYLPNDESLEPASLQFAREAAP